jgi:hypothetical protein
VGRGGAESNDGGNSKNDNQPIEEKAEHSLNMLSFNKIRNIH